MNFTTFSKAKKHFSTPSPKKTSKLEYYSQLKATLINLFLKAKPIITEMGLDDIIWKGIIKENGINQERRTPNNLSGLLLRLKDEKFRVAVTGTYNSGKSTTINALLGRNLLPADHLPATDIITEVQYAKNEKIKIYFRKNIPISLTELRKTIKNKKLFQHIATYQHKLGGIPVFEETSHKGITSDYLKGISSIPEDERGKKRNTISLFEKVVLCVDNQLLSHGIILTDTPGKDIYDIHNKITSDCIANADLVLLILDADMGLNTEKMENLKNEFDRFGNNLLVIANRVDRCYRERASKEKRQRIIGEKYNFLVNHIRHLIDEDRIFVISAEIGLLNIIEPDELNKQMQVEVDLFAKFKNYFEAFLTRDAFTNKLISSGETLILRMLDIKNKYVSNRKKLLSGNIEEIKSKAEKIIKRIILAKRDLEKIVQNISSEVKSIKKSSANLIEGYLQNLYDYDISSWVTSFKSGGTPSELPNVFASYIRRKLKSSFNDWCKQILAPVINEKMRKYDSYLNEEKLNRVLEKVFKEKLEIEGLVKNRSFIDNGDVVSNRKRFIANWKRSIADLSKGEADSFVYYSVADLFTEGITSRLMREMPFDAILSQGGFYYAIAKIFEWLHNKLKTSSKSWWARFRNFLADLFSNWSSLIASTLFQALKPQFIRKITTVLENNHHVVISSINQIWEEYNEKMLSTVEAELYTDLKILEQQANTVKKNASQGENEIKKQQEQLKAIEIKTGKIVSEIEFFLVPLKSKKENSDEKNKKLLFKV